MLNRTGLILKLQDNIAFVISKDCMYYQIKKKPGMIKGQTVEFNQSDIIDNRSFWKRHNSLIAAAAALLIIMVSIIVYINSGFNSQNKIYAFIDIDINPSLEIAIDKERNIQHLYPLNKDAEILLSGLDLEEVPMEDGLSKIIDKSKQLGFLNTKDKDVVLISAALNGNKEDTGTLISDICSDINQLKDKNIKTQVIDVPLETRKLALENKISMGRYVLYEKARESGLNVSIEAVKAISLENILEKVNLNGIQVNNSIVPTPIPQPRPSQGNSGKPHPANIYNPSQGKGNNPAPIFMSTPAPIQGHIPTPIPQHFPALTPIPVKTVQSDSDKNTPGNFTPVPTLIPTPTPSLTPTATATLLPTDTPLPQGSISMSFDTTEIHTIGQVICATLEVNNIRGLSGFEANLKYDPQVLQPVNSAGKAYKSTTIPENGTLLQNKDYSPFSYSFNDLSNGILYFSRSYLKQGEYKKEGPEEYTGSLAVIRFKVLQLKNTNITFQNTNNSLNEKSGIVLFDWDGAIPNFDVIQPGPLVVNLDYKPVIVPESSKSPNYATGGPTSTRTPTPTSIFLHTPTLTPTLTPTPTPVIKNYDINGDGYINMEDSLLIDKAYNTSIGEPNYNPDSDLNSDGAVSMSDKMAFMGYLSKHMEPISTTPSVPYSTKIPVTTPVSQNYISMSFDTTEINTVGQVIIATLEVNNIRNLAGFQANLQYDPEVLQPVTASGGSYKSGTNPGNGSLLLNPDYQPINVSFNNIPNGILYFGRNYSWLKGYKADGPEEHTGKLAAIQFKVLQLKDTSIIFRNTNNSMNEKSGIVLSDWDGEVISNFEVVQPGTLTVNPGNNPTITPTATPMATPLVKSLDINSDGIVDANDVTAMINAYNTKSTDPNFNPAADLNSDGAINSFDTSLLGISFGESQDKGIMPLPTTPVIKSFDITQDGSIDAKDMEALDKALNSFGFMPNYNSAADLNSNSIVSIADRTLLMNYFNQNNIPIPAMPVLKSLDINGDGSIGQLDSDIFVSLSNVKSTDPNYNPAADLNSDGIIDNLDMMQLFIYHTEHADLYIHTPSTPRPTSTPVPIKNCDINGDGYVNTEDGQLINQAFNTLVGEPNYNPACDLNSDGVVNMSDQMLFLKYLSQHTPPVSTISDTPCPTNVIHTPVPTLESTRTPTPTPILAPSSTPTGL